MLNQSTISPTFGDDRLPARFWAKVRVLENGCWECQGSKVPSGYGSFWWQGKQHRAHRLAYQVLVSLIPWWLEADHLCRNPSCVWNTGNEPKHREGCVLAEMKERYA